MQPRPLDIEKYEDLVSRFSNTAISARQDKEKDFAEEVEASPKPESSKAT